VPLQHLHRLSHFAVEFTRRNSFQTHDKHQRPSI
jgi:hypothetical protein